MLSHQNRDLVTTRSFETLSWGGLLCAERTSEHQLLYEDSYEAVFWDSTDECIARCSVLLNDQTFRDYIRNNGIKRIKEFGAGNEDILSHVMSLL